MNSIKILIIGAAILTACLAWHQWDVNQSIAGYDHWGNPIYYPIGVTKDTAWMLNTYHSDREESWNRTHLEVPYKVGVHP